MLDILIVYLKSYNHLFMHYYTQKS